MLDEMTARQVAERTRQEHPDWDVQTIFVSPAEIREIWERMPEAHERPLPDLLTMNVGWRVEVTLPDGTTTVQQHMPSWFDPRSYLFLDDDSRIRMGDARRTHLRQALAYVLQDPRSTETEQVQLRAYLADRLGAFWNDTETLAVVERRDFGWIPTE